MFGYIIILPIIANVRKIVLLTGGRCLVTRQKRQNIFLYRSLKQLPWQPDIQELPRFMLDHVGRIDVFMLGCIQFLSITK